MLGLGRIMISNIVVANLLMYSLPGMILLYLAAPFITPKMFLDEIFITCITTIRYRFVTTYIFHLSSLYISTIVCSR